MKRLVIIFLTGVAIAVLGLAYWLFRPLPNVPQPAAFHCLPTGPDDAALAALDVAPTRIYGLGMTYSGHIDETAWRYDPDVPPPIFTKATDSMLRGDGVVAMPSRQDWLDAAEKMEPGLASILDDEFPDLPVLLDYEVELGFVLLDDVTIEQLADPGFAPQLGYFIANDLTSRSFQVLGRGQPNKFEYWGAAKSFPGFTVVGKEMWVPVVQAPDSIPCVTITTTVGGEIRQQQSTADMIYAPKQMLRFVSEAFPDAPLQQGDMVFTGTPPGVAFAVPRWRLRIAELAGFGRMKSLGVVTDSHRDDPRFLQPGDRVTVSSPLLGTSTVLIAE